MRWESQLMELEPCIMDVVHVAFHKGCRIDVTLCPPNPKPLQHSRIETRSHTQGVIALRVHPTNLQDAECRICLWHVPFSWNDFPTMPTLETIEELQTAKIWKIPNHRRHGQEMMHPAKMSSGQQAQQKSHFVPANQRERMRQKLTTRTEGAVVLCLISLLTFMRQNHQKKMTTGEARLSEKDKS